MFTYLFERGDAPLLVSMPHAGTLIPPDIEARMTPAALKRADTDWHQPQLYNFLSALGANVLVALNSRYVIDLNRSPDGVPLYANADSTELCPTTTFIHEPLYQAGETPSAAEITSRTENFFKPYHAKIAETLAEIKARHGYALLFEAHSIKSVLPRFFDGTLPDINLGTADGASCGPGIGDALLDAARSSTQHSSVLNGRFKGGYITRAFGDPANNIHTVQLELTWKSYMAEDESFAFDEARAAAVRPTLQKIVERFLAEGARG
jgi:N-formylglutamate deformylase